MSFTYSRHWIIEFGGTTVPNGGSITVTTWDSDSTSPPPWDIRDDSDYYAHDPNADDDELGIDASGGALISELIDRIDNVLGEDT